MAKKIDYASMFTRRKDGRYQGSYTDDTGRHYVYDRDPERLWHKLNDPKEKPIILFSELADAWDAEHQQQISYKTAEAYTAPLRRIKEQFEKREIETITASEISAYLSSLGKKGFSRRSVQMHRDILNMIFNKAIVDGVTRFNPVAAVAMPKSLSTTHRELPSDDAIEAIKVSTAPFSLFAKICLYSGLRRGEALALRYEDVDRQNKIIRVTKAVEFVGNNPHIKQPKTANGYRNAILLDVLANEIPNGEGYIFTNSKNEMLTKIQYRERWQHYCEAIGFNLTAHQLRHGFATILYEAGISDKDAQELLGHSTITLTRNVYTHIRQARREETAARLNDYISAVSGKQ